MQAERGRKINEAVRFETRQHDLRERERVNPLPRELVRARLTHDEPLVKAGVMRNQIAIARKLDKRMDCVARAWGTINVDLRYARELRDFEWDGVAGVDEGVKLVDGLVSVHANCRNLEQRAF